MHLKNYFIKYMDYTKFFHIRQIIASIEIIKYKL